MTIDYDTLATRLTPEARSLFSEMVAAHLATSGDRLFVRCDSKDGTSMIFTAGAKPRPSWENFDGGAIDDLVDYGLLRAGSSRAGTPHYRIPSEALAFHRWLMEHQGGAITQVEEAVRRMLSSDAFAQAHPNAAHHLNEAFALLWEGGTELTTVSEIGDHLRKALMDTTTEIVGPGQQEKPVEALRQWVASTHGHQREKDVLVPLVDLTRAILRLDHRLNHVRDEADNRESPPRWEEIRRAAFVTALVCYELGRLRSEGN